MSAYSRRTRHTVDIWPGFVDALAALLMVTIFMLMVFVLAQMFLSKALSGRDEALVELNQQVAQLAGLLSLETEKSQELRDTVAQLSSELQSSLAARDDLALQLSAMTTRAGESAAAVAKLGAELEDAFKTIAADKEKVELQLRELAALRQDIEALRETRKSLEADLGKERELSATSKQRVDSLNRQILALRQQLARIALALEVSEAKQAEQNVQIADLGKRLNVALAGKVAELARYRSEFFGRLREVIGERADIRIVGDRFVFQSEVLFASGSAEIGADGKRQLAQLGTTLLDVASRIPADLEWVLRIDGHTDKLPIRTTEFPSNWELSTARAVSVVKQLIAAGVPANRLAAAGFGQYHPLDDHDDEISYRRNRRIEIKLTER